MSARNSHHCVPPSSCIYEGWIHHRRRLPQPHRFKYPIFFVFLDLEALPEVFDGTWLWSARRPSLAWFRREDHLLGSHDDLAEDIRELVEDQTGRRPTGKVYLLTHLRYFGYVFNPISVYYCYADDGTLSDLVLEVSNTPWGERHWYVLPQAANQAGSPDRRLHQMNKQMHVSPFMPMDMSYRLRANVPNQRLSLALSTWRDGQSVFQADLALTRRALNAGALNLMLLKFPFLTLRVTMAIHWQALRLWLKKTPLFVHPSKQPATGLEELP